VRTFPGGMLRRREQVSPPSMMLKVTVVAKSANTSVLKANAPN